MGRKVMIMGTSEFKIKFKCGNPVGCSQELEYVPINPNAKRHQKRCGKCGYKNEIHIPASNQKALAIQMPNPISHDRITTICKSDVPNSSLSISPSKNEEL